MNRVNGNLAYKNKYISHNKRTKEIVQPKIHDEISLIRNLQKQLSRQRMLSLVFILSLVLIITGAFSGILIRNSRILEMNYANIRLEREISQLQKDTTIIREELAKKTNLDTIRQIASQQLLMQEPGQRQIEMVVIPNTDILIVESNIENKDLANDDMSEIFGNLEGFFKRFK